MKNSSYNWIWKWHMIGGLVSFPVIVILVLTGIIYLFKDQYEQPRQASIKEVSVEHDRLSYDNQLNLARQSWDKNINSVVLPNANNQATTFVSGRFSGKSSLYVNPYTGKITGMIAANQTDMFKVRKLHGELLTGSVGTKVVELVGSWLIVLIISGLVIFFPRKRKDWIKLFRVRFGAAKAIVYRDLHQVCGFWFSIVLFLILAGGMPWTDVWGEGFKWVQKQTGTGYPPAWHGIGIQSSEGETVITLDEAVHFAQALQLPGEVTISLPKSPKGVYSIHNIDHANQSKQVAIHLDQYTGKILARLNWTDVGFLMRGRMWAMAFHQGQFGFWNWILVMITAFGLLVLSVSGVVAYFVRKKSGTWGLPNTEATKLGAGYTIFIVTISVMLPLFGLSAVLILLIDKLSKYKTRKVQRGPVAS